MTIDLIFQGIRLVLNKERKGFVKTSQIVYAMKIGIQNYFSKNLAEYKATGFIPDAIRPMVKTATIALTNGSGTLPRGTAQVNNVALSGTTGTANISGIGGLTKLATFNTSLTQTAADFVTAYAAAYAAVGIIVTSDTSNIIFTAAIPGAPQVAPVIANATGNLSGVSTQVTANVTAAFEKEVSFTVPGINNFAGDFLPHDEFMDRRNSVIVGPTQDDPIAEIIGNTVRVEPSDTASIEMIYISRPVEIIYAEVIDGDGRGSTFNSGTSIDTDFTVSSVPDLIKEALMILGVKQQDQPATQLGATTNK